MWRLFAKVAGTGVLGLALLSSGATQAQEINAQRFAPSTDADLFAVTQDTEVQGSGTSGGLFYNYAKDPFIYRYDDDREEESILGSVATTDLLGAVNMGNLQVSVDVPLHLQSSGYHVDGFRLLGDTALGARMAFTSRATGQLGTAASARLTLPTGKGDSWLGASSATAEARLHLATGDSLVLATNLGIRHGAKETIDELTLGTRFTWTAGASLPLTDALRIAAELDGETHLASLGSPGASPVEGLVSLRARPMGSWVASLGAGAGLSQGIGAPDVRVLAAIGWFPAGSASTTPMPGPVTATADSDGDGITDDADLCPDQAEDRNGQADHDGCPEGGLTPTILRVQDPGGAQVTGATIELQSGPETGLWTSSDGELARSLPPGSYEVLVSAAGYNSTSETLTVPAGPGHEATFRIKPAAGLGTLTVNVTDADGNPLHATVRILGAPVRIQTDTDGVGQGKVPPGTHELVIHAADHGVARRTLKVESGATASMDVVLKESRVRVTDQRIVILDKVFFELDSAVIKPESFPLLDEVVAILLDHPEIAMVEVQGHTDDQGSEEYNLKLSQSRAEAVMTYLVRAGVPGRRLVARGYGENRSLQDGTSEEARAANRRVEFHIVRRDPVAKPDGQPKPPSRPDPSSPKGRKPPRR
ncbi:MAG: OmpA family protein [Myxococcota bacterium]|nr:OmpA family protein [Myxococcota bacterium]